MNQTDRFVCQNFKEPVDLVIAIAGNPNVGKSVIFNQLTGVGVICSNYPGSTVEMCLGTTEYAGHKIGVVDMPGAYSFGAAADDQIANRRFILEEKPEAVLFVLDSTNLERNLYFLIQLIDLKVPLVVMLNLLDEAGRLGLEVDAENLSALLGVPVIPGVATEGRGVKEAFEISIDVALGLRKIQPIRVAYGRDVEETISSLSAVMLKELEEPPYGLPVRSLALLMLEGDREITKLVGLQKNGPGVMEAANRLAGVVEERHGEPAGVRISRERFGLAGVIAGTVKNRADIKLPISQRLWGLTIKPATGLPIMISVLAAMFFTLFAAGNYLSGLLSQIWQAGPSPLIKDVVYALAGHGELGRTLLWGFDAGIEAALTIAIPYVLVFYVMLAVLEDTGYLNSIAFLTDTFVHKLGLHGQAVIPMVAGAGCNVPALIGTRVLPTSRERFIASFLVVLVPCSARITVVIGGVGRYAGVGYALGIFAVSFLLTIAVGFALNKMLPGEPSGLVMEMFGLRRPSIKAMALKTWWRFREFFFIALPTVIAGSLALGGLYETGWLWTLSAPLKPLVEGWLGLPMIAGVSLIFGILRKELALQFLVTFGIAEYGSQAVNLLTFMTKSQLFVYGLVSIIYIPCLAAIAVLGRELGWKRAMAIVSFTIAASLLLGGLANLIL